MGMVIKNMFGSPLGATRTIANRDGAVVRVLASHQCGPGSIPGPGVLCGLSLLLVLYSAPRGFARFSPLLKNQHFQIPIRSWNAQTFLNEFLRTPWCSVGKQITFTFILTFTGNRIRTVWTPRTVSPMWSTLILSFGVVRSELKLY